MLEKNIWNEESDNVIKYLYEDMKIFNWQLISTELTSKLGLNVDANACRIRYQQKYGPVHRDEWTPEEQKELYRLHNENGNKWAVIALNLLGRNDNCVKNHFYSKLRKSLRTLNKIAKFYLKKQAKQVSDVVLYKLTQATDQSLKQNSDLPKQTIFMCFDLKNRLLQYETDQKDIKGGIDYTFQKQLIQGLSQFNRVYKKKSKKEKVTVQGTENLKKKENENQKKKKRKPTQKVIKYEEESEEISESSESSQQKYVKVASKVKRPNKVELRKFQANLHYHYSQQAFSQRSESQISVPKRTVNFFIKAPSQQEKNNYQKPLDLMSEPKKSQKQQHEQQFYLAIPFTAVAPIFPIKTNNRVQDILKAEGILQNGQYGIYGRDVIRSNSVRSVRSFSVCSQSSHPDMFGEDIGFTVGFKELSQMDNQSQIFHNQQHQ